MSNTLRHTVIRNLTLLVHFDNYIVLLQVANSEPGKRAVLMVLFVLGVILFYLSLDFLTDPEIYSNNIYVGEL